MTRALDGCGGRQDICISFSFFSDRGPQLTIKTKTHFTKLSRGVPQGSPLLATLFAIYVNDLPRIWRREVKSQLFADDFILRRQVDKDGFPSTDH